VYLGTISAVSGLNDTARPSCCDRRDDGVSASLSIERWPNSAASPNCCWKPSSPLPPNSQLTSSQLESRCRSRLLRAADLNDACGGVDRSNVSTALYPQRVRQGVSMRRGASWVCGRQTEPTNRLV
jgi:hypothetical protein